MATEYRYPDETSVTHFWLPTSCPLLDGSPQRPERGLIRARAIGGRPVLYQMADPTKVHLHHFKLLMAEYEAWDTFIGVVSGRQFRMRDDFIGDFITVVWWEESEWTPIRSTNGAVDRVEGTITLLRVAP